MQQPPPDGVSGRVAGLAHEFAVQAPLEVKPPRVSIVIPCYNATACVGDALDSVFAQEWTDFEVIVVNDGCHDTTGLEAALEPYAERIRYLRQRNWGPAAARNLGIRAARGEFIAFLDSDDAWYPRFLADQVHALSARPELAMTYCETLLYGDSPRAGKTLGRLVGRPGRVSIENLVGRRCIIHPSTVVARRSALLAAGLFDERISHSEDLELWLRMLRSGRRIGFVPRVLARRATGRQRLSADVEKLIRSQLRISEEHLNRSGPLSASQAKALRANVERCRARLEALYGIRAVLAGDDAAARDAWVAANRVLRDWRIVAARFCLSLSPRLTRAACRRFLQREGIFLQPEG